MVNEKKIPYLIYEIANTHAGNIAYAEELIYSLSHIAYKKSGVKFQPFYYDSIALPDCEGYPVYKKLYFDINQWSSLIRLASTTIGDVWLDIFDTYGVEVLVKNLKQVQGIKLQASVLENQEVYGRLSECSLNNIKLIINIAAHGLESITSFILKFSQLNVHELILQVGFQAYPTQVKDVLLNKINTLKYHYPELKICFADHTSGTDNFATIVPLIASLSGCEYIEKHVCLNRATTEYDHHSSLEIAEIENLCRDFEKLQTCFSSSFISDAEKVYLNNSQQIPVLRTSKSAGVLLTKEDFIYRRTKQSGILFSEIEDMQNKKYILSSEKDMQSTLNRKDFKKANIGVIVAGRMKSTRLQKKAILPIAGIASIERCLQNCLLISEADQVILATSTVEEDTELEVYATDGNVKFWQGDPEDVISRYLGACEQFGIDIIVRVTADCPVISPEIVTLLLNSHFESGADYTGTNKCAVGTAAEIYNVSALKRVISHFGKAGFSEYMTWYMRNNQDFFKVNTIDLPAKFIRDYRLTLDFPEDLEMFNRLYFELDKNGSPPTLKNVFEVLDKHSDIVKINNHMEVVYRSDKKLINQLNKVTRMSEEVS